MTTNLNAQPNELDLILYAGDGVTIALTFIENGEPWPTTGVWSADVRPSEVGEVVASFNVVNEEAEGLVTISLSGEQVRALGNDAVWDLEQIAPGADPRTWYRGAITVKGDVTRGDVTP